MESKLSLARVKIKFPEQLWISKVYKDFTDIKMEIISFLPYNLERAIGNSIIEIMHFKLKAITDLIKIHPSVVEFNILEQEENRIRFNVKTEDPFLLYAVIKCGVLVNFPVNVREGYAYWRLISTRKRIDKLLTIFEQKGIEFELLRIGNSPYSIEKNINKLTFKEEGILNRAINTGFFEVPRKISLEELAKQMDKSKSALSVKLRKIIQKKVMYQA